MLKWAASLGSGGVLSLKGTECGLTRRAEGESLEHSRLCDLSRSLPRAFPPIDYLSIRYFHLSPLHFPPPNLLWDELTLAISFSVFHTLPQLKVGHHRLLLSQSLLSPLIYSSFCLVNLNHSLCSLLSFPNVTTSSHLFLITLSSFFCLHP